MALLLLLAGTLQAQDSTPLPQPEPPPAPLISVEQAEAKVAELQREATQSVQLAKYQLILEQAKSIAQWTSRKAEFQSRIDTLPQRIESIKAELANAPSYATPEISDASPLSDLERVLAEYDAAAAAAREEVERVGADQASNSEERKNFPEQMAKARQLLEAINQASLEGPSPEVPAPIKEADDLLRQLQEQAIRTEIEAREKQNIQFENRTTFLNLRRDQAIRKLDRAERNARAYRQLVTARRQLEAEQAAEKARLEALALIEEATSDPLVQRAAVRLASENAKLAEKRSDLLKRIESTQRDTQAVDQRLSQVSRDFKNVNQRVDAAGLNNSIGRLLRRFKVELPDVRVHRKNLRTRQETLSAIQIDQIDLQDQRDELANVEQTLQNLLGPKKETQTDLQRNTQENLLRDMLATKISLLDELLKELVEYTQNLGGLDLKERDLIGQTEAFEIFIDEHVLWIPSGGVLRPKTFLNALAGLKWLVSPERYNELLTATLYDWITNPLLNILGVALLVGLVGFRRRIRLKLEEVGKAAAKPSCVSLWLTLEALLYTLLLAASVSAILAFWGWRLHAPIQNPESARAFGFALLNVSLVVFAIDLFRQTIRDEGLAGAHFGWPGTARRVLRPLVGRLLLAAVPTVFVVSLIRWYKLDAFEDSLGRILFLVTTGYIVAFCQSTLRPKNGVFQLILDFSKSSSRNRFRYVWYGLGVGLSTLILVLTLLGYFYTAYRLGTRLFFTLFITLGVVLLHGIVLRWRFLAYRVLARERARRRRELLKTKDEDENAEIERRIEEEEEISLEESDLQTQRVLRSITGIILLVGIWFLWAEELPALSLLNSVELWPVGTATQVAIDPQGVESTVETVEYFTLGKLALAVLIGLMTFGATRNLPGLLEIAFLQRLEIGRGQRYAVTSVVRYFLIGLGLILIFNSIGVGWGKVQWLVAALSVGLGFGLQEIFANFVSGLIILFEQPVRLGDVVTVGGTSGTVSRIRIRATTITDFDLKELIVPNKEFVTGHLINWSLSDSTLRLVIPVGIAYGSDTERAAQILASQANQETLVLETPAPVVLFGAFGASSLDFELRVYVQSVDDLTPVRNRLHFAIDKAFREAGIEIAFPQQDVHLDTAQPLTVHLSRDLQEPPKETSD